MFATSGLLRLSRFYIAGDWRHPVRRAGTMVEQKQVAEDRDVRCATTGDAGAATTAVRKYTMQI